MRTIITAGLIAAAATIAAIAPAQASCFYNKSEIRNLGVSMNCGWFCRNDWNIKPGDHACRGGGGGQFWINGKGNETKARDSYYLAGEVDDHGYVTVTGSCKTGIKVQVWRQDHSLRQDMSFNMSVECS